MLYNGEQSEATALFLAEIAKPRGPYALVELRGPMGQCHGRFLYITTDEPVIVREPGEDG